jgi:hypothetical protein
MLRAMILVSLAFALFKIEAYSCECERLPVSKKIEMAKVVFLGQILEVSDAFGSPYPHVVKFKVEKQWKGDVVDEITISIGRDRPGWCKDIPLITGRRYLIYARWDEREKKLVMGGDCGPYVAAEFAAKEIKQIECIKQGRPCRDKKI